MFTDNKDFYPTPKLLFNQLMNGTRFLKGRILEPSAGKGDMIKHIRQLNGQRDDLKIDAIESDGRLVGILQSEDINVVWHDFLTYETYKEYDFIIMNPPFSNGVDHALKAIDLAEKQAGACEIYMILNKETIDNAYSNKRKDLLKKLEDYNAGVRYVKSAFSQSERRTDVEVALINMVVEIPNEGKSIYDSIPFFTTQDQTESELETALSTYVKDGEMQSRLNDIERLVLEYETACKVARSAFKAQKEKESFMSYIRNVNKKDLHDDKLYMITSKGFTTSDLNEELDRLRRGYWQLILDTDDFKDILTNDAIQKLNRQMHLAEEMEINYTNIKMLLMALGANKEDILMDSIVSMFKEMTKYHMNQYSTNIHYYNGWKTNNAYKINHKIIIPIKHQFEPLWDFKESYKDLNSQTKNYIDDIVKAFQLIDPNVESDFRSISNQEFENNLLRFKMFLNGNIHIWFKDLELLNKFNYLCGSHFNWIPSTEEQKASKKAREFVYKEFGHVDDIKLIAI